MTRHIHASSALKIQIARPDFQRHTTSLFPYSRQNGAVAIMSGLLIVPLIGICGLAIDLGMVYSRQTEMRNLAHAIAISSAKKLNGTTAGISDAVATAAQTAALFKYNNHLTDVNWSPTAIQFSTTPDRAGAWVDSGGASADAGRMFYVKVSTKQLDGAGEVFPALMPILSDEFKKVTVGTDIVAGKASIEVAPLAICALSTTPASKRVNPGNNAELVEYGFRRGVSYDLMNLNPSGTTALNFAINPVSLPGTAGSAGDFSAANLGPYACTGTLAIPRVTGDPVAVARPFPLAGLYKQLNTRFDTYDSSVCSHFGAPPDTNIASYLYTKMNPASSPTMPWMTVAPAGQTAASVIDSGRLVTIADVPPSGTAAQYGPLWAYAKAVPYSAYSAGTLEPVNGYATFATDTWPSLYAGQSVNTYPSGTATPYKPGSGNNLVAPNASDTPSLRNRRVLNVPLLDCSVTPGSSATVKAVGKFFMTVPATSTMLAAEFAGIAPPQRIDGSVKVFE